MPLGVRTQGRRVRALIRRRARARHPERLRTLVPGLRAAIAGNKIGASRALLDGALSTTDATGVDLDVLLDAGYTANVAHEMRRIATYVREHGQQANATKASQFPRLPTLMDALDGPPEGLEQRLDDWATSPADRVLAFKVALALKLSAPLVLLAPHIQPTDLTVPQRSRAALALWRAGANDRGLELALAVPAGDTASARRARMVTAEQESFALMDSGWTVPERIDHPAYEPRTGSVLHVLHNSLPYRRTGAANRTQGLLSSLVREGYAITALTPPGFPYDDVAGPAAKSVVARHEIDGVVYQHLLNDGAVLPRFPVQEFIAAYSASILEHARAESAELIHAASNSYNALSALTAGRQLGIPTIYEVRGLYEEVRRSKNPSHADTPQYRFARHLETLAATEADHVIAITDGLKDTLIDRGVPVDSITVVPNGVDTERFRPLPRDEELARSYGLEDKVVIGYLGSLNWYEGHELLFEAFARVHQRHPQARLLIVGDGARLTHLKRLRAQLGLEEEILMPGSVPFEQVEAHYSIVDIAPVTRLSSPVTESVSPLKPFEAMAMGKTVLSSDVAIMTEIVDDGRTGLLFRKDDVDSLVEALDRLVADPDLLTRLGAAAREWVAAERDWRTLAKRVAAVYRDLGVDPVPARDGV
ncbi:MAG: hypothetical protein JWR83_22 [Aeromicrobium sp.]|nr:hypothetical protein [Aeromicrobium sp.]